MISLLASNRTMQELADLVGRQSVDRQAALCELMATLSEKLRAAIEASDLSLYALAKASGVSLPIITRFMAGERDIRFETADKLAETLGLDLVERKPKPKR